jgi:hypothetical protein
MQQNMQVYSCEFWHILLLLDKGVTQIFTWCVYFSKYKRLTLIVAWEGAANSLKDI